MEEEINEGMFSRFRDWWTSLDTTDKEAEEIVAKASVSELMRMIPLHVTDKSAARVLNNWEYRLYKAARKRLEAMKPNMAEQALQEKAVSKSQQKLMGMALAYKRGEQKDVPPEAKRLAKQMSEKDLEDFAKTKHDGLPDKVDESLALRRFKKIVKESRSQRYRSAAPPEDIDDKELPGGKDFIDIHHVEIPDYANIDSVEDANHEEIQKSLDRMKVVPRHNDNTVREETKKLTTKSIQETAEILQNIRSKEDD